MTQTFIIKSLIIQNSIMLIALGLGAFFLLRSILKKSKYIGLFLLWLIFVFYLFNSPFWGFSAVQVGPQKVKVYYGILSFFKNKQLDQPVTVNIYTFQSGFPTFKKLHYLSINSLESMKVEHDYYPQLQKIVSEIKKYQK